MEKYSRMIIEMMKEAKLFAPQGGPIILAQVWLVYNWPHPLTNLDYVLIFFDIVYDSDRK